MAKFFVNRPIVAIVISIIFVIVGIVAILGLPIAQYPDIVPPEIVINTTYVGADAQTVEQSVATPIEQEMSGVDNMNYMYSLNANNGELKLYVNFDVKTDPNIDQVLAQMRKAQADSKLPSEVRDYGVTVKKSTSSPLMLVALSSPGGTYDATFLANYAYINLNDQLTRVPGSQCHRLRCRSVRHASVGETRPACQAEPHCSGDRGCHQKAEYGQPGRSGGK
jgi:hydrophobic/amphiphilic exporter-1 (mainly G- bacteria), HAE1 family